MSLEKRLASLEARTGTRSGGITAIIRRIVDPSPDGPITHETVRAEYGGIVLPRGPSEAVGAFEARALDNARTAHPGRIARVIFNGDPPHAAH